MLKFSVFKILLKKIWPQRRPPCFLATYKIVSIRSVSTEGCNKYLFFKLKIIFQNRFKPFLSKFQVLYNVCKTIRKTIV